MKRILAIETSCDETAAAIVEGNGEEPVRVVGQALASQIALHRQYGGVFPDLAAREHTKRILPVLGSALHDAGLIDNPRAAGQSIQRALAGVDALAVTNGPGLIGPLLVGTAAAMQLAKLSGKPLIGINHWEGHIYSAFLQSGPVSTQRFVVSSTGSFNNLQLTTDNSPATEPQFPLLVLTVSGGHTSLILMKHHLRYEILGQTLDDAAGEAFDKCARLLGLPYPGGPEISRRAALARSSDRQLTLKLPRPMLNRSLLDFSFSGLKTAVRYAIDRGDIRLPQDIDPAAREIEDAIIDVLLGKLAQAIAQTKPNSVAIVGGVSANRELRHRAREQLTVYVPDPQYSTDNAAMIGAAAIYRLARNESGVTDPLQLVTNASARL